MNLCEEMKCSACCFGMVHRGILIPEATFILRGSRYTFVSRKIDFDGLASRTKIPVVFSNSRVDPIKSSKRSESRVSLVIPGKCFHLDRNGRCENYDNRATSCKSLIPGSRECRDLSTF